MVFIIPAYNPTNDLIRVIYHLTTIEVYRIIVVDDGSDCKEIFKRIKSKKNVEILKHSTNFGKGKALKTAFNHIINKYKDIKSVITIDADGQHKIEDVLRIALDSINNPEKLILGCRNFQLKNVPIRSKIGNIITRKILSFFTSKIIHDTQTGLRAIPIDFLPKLVRIKLNGFNFEFEMLIKAINTGMQIKEDFISTVYINKNSNSNFDPIFDSIKIYFVLLKFALMCTLKKIARICNDKFWAIQASTRMVQILPLLIN
ncbi:MAG: glycosyltransferase family 2 protein [bacterium]|nr:glycosyltransferase family 2 protein [bacterium]